MTIKQRKKLDWVVEKFKMEVIERVVGPLATGDQAPYESSTLVEVLIQAEVLRVDTESDGSRVIFLTFVGEQWWKSIQAGKVSPSVAEARQIREELEESIARMLTEFESKVGVPVKGIDLDRRQPGPHPGYVYVDRPEELFVSVEVSI
jgi:hypothetical protein